MTHLAYSYCSLIIFIIFQINSFVTPLKCYKCKQCEHGTDCLIDYKKPKYVMTCKPFKKSMPSKIKNDSVSLSTNTLLEILSMELNSNETNHASCMRFITKRPNNNNYASQIRGCTFYKSCKEISDRVQNKLGLTVHDCHVCRKDLCNSSPKNDASVSTIVFISVLIFIWTQIIKFY